MASNPSIAEIKARLEEEVARKHEDLERLKQRLAAADDLEGFYNTQVPGTDNRRDPSPATGESRKYADMSISDAALDLLASKPDDKFSTRRVLEHLKAGGIKMDSKNPFDLVAQTLRYRAKNDRIRQFRDRHGTTYQHKPG